MQINSLLNFFIGMTLTFGCFALMVSSITEAVASLFSLRSRTLLSGLKGLLNDPNLDSLARDILNNAAVRPFSPGTMPAGGKPSDMPSYIDPAHFAGALIDSVHKVTDAKDPFANLRDSLAGIKDQQVREHLVALFDRANGNVDVFKLGVAGWFDASMDRLSGNYKRWSQFISCVIALVLAVVINVDAIHIAQILWADPKMADKVQIPADAKSYVAAMDAWSTTFPLGWTNFSGSDRSWIFMVAGWLIAATAALFGAPFWFDTLQRFVQLRGTGPAPGETKPGTARPSLPVVGSHNPPVSAPVPVAANVPPALPAQPGSG